jgi:hypothetical protein
VDGLIGAAAVLVVAFIAELIYGIRTRKVYRVARFENASARRIYLPGYGRINFQRGEMTPVISHLSGNTVPAGLAAEQLAEELGGEWTFVGIEKFDGQELLRYVDPDAEIHELHESLERDQTPPHR